jgi:hypothetical protein
MQGRASTAGRGIARWLAAVAATLLVAPAAAAAETYTVTGPNDSQGFCEGTACSSLRAALRVAGERDTIRLPAYDTPYNQQLGTFTIDSSVRLVGDGADETVITGDTGRTFYVGDPQSEAAPDVVMEHLQVAFGHEDFGSGGNIANYANLRLDHVRVRQGRAGAGGGVANLGGTLVIEHSLIDQNLATSSDAIRRGGGVYSWSYSAGALMIRDSTIAFNGAEAGGGVAVEYYGESPMAAAVLERVTLARNATSGPPGGLWLGQGATVLVNGSILAENRYDPPQVARGRAVVAPKPSNCDPLRRPVDGGGNLSNTDDCGFKNPPADPKLSGDLEGGLGETPLLTIPSDSPAVGLAGDCQGTDQRDLARPQGDACDAGAFEVMTPTPTPAPPPEIVSGPAGPTTDSSPSFTFLADAAAFECRLDGPAGEGPWEPCTSPRTYASLPSGGYTFYVRADGGEPAARAFSVAAPQAQSAPLPSALPAQTPAPTPVYRQSVSVKPTKGTVKVKLPGTNRYVALERLDTIPFGASIDVRKGRVRLYAARDRRGRLQAASFYSGVFRVVQRGSYVELQLRGPKPVCGSGQASASTYKPKKKKARTRRLWGSGKGRFRTRGQYSAATVRGTKWLVQDSCRSTTTRVKHGVVTVRDFKRKKTIILRAGDRYVARRR